MILLYIRCWLNRNVRIATLIVPILIICCINITLVGLMLAEKMSNRNRISIINLYSNNRINSTMRDLITIVGCVLFSGIKKIQKFFLELVNKE